MRNYINFLIGHSLYIKGKYNDALTYYNQVNEQHLCAEDNEEFTFTKAFAHLTQKEYKQASRYFYSQIGFNKKYNQEAEYYYAYCEFSQQNYPDALETFINIPDNSKFYESAQYHSLQI